ncbi:subtilisin-like protein [Artomyces pyxidatus]|uniref:Subtilisin-like protein n=1 Tax=Artomyces pyxidatus TaxID=48021 RepID=A0ACB8T8G6_9AGAM|nr:subtilisin-like protein [Artomyces pyxidatus]
MLWRSSFLTAVVPLCFASPIFPRWDDLEVKHAWSSVPRNWISVGLPPNGTTIDLRIALKPHREDALVGALYEVSDPAHEKYGAHLSKEEVATLVAPHPDTVELVHAWLGHHGVPASSIRPSYNGGWLTITSLPASQADALLGASYQVYRHTETDETLLRTVEYSLPVDLHAHVALVAPTTYFGGPRALHRTSRLTPTAKHLLAGALDDPPESPTTVSSSCAGMIVPSCLQALYNTGSYTPTATDQNTLGITGYLQENASQADLTLFLSKLMPDAATADFTVVSVAGGTNDQNNPTLEASLDIQYAESLAFPTPTIFYTTGGSPPFQADENTPANTNEPYLDWLDFILAQSDIPQTISTSYGDDEQTVPPDYAQTVCSLFAQLGAQGVSVLFSSGDTGVGDDCVSNDGLNTPMFLPNFPATCPYITAVGGTTGVNPETAAGLSSGGFSNYFARPSYQDTAVSNFISGLGTQFSGLYNASGRGFPDISAQAENFIIVIGQEPFLAEGTSCAAPTVSAIVSLLNDYLISQGKSPLGFLNPLLYSTGAAGLNDITSGSNPGCNTDGFSAVEGWDPVTGLGTPDFGKLQAIVG